MAGWKSAEMGTHLVQEFCRFCRESKRLRQLLRDTRRCFREINSVRGADGSKSRFHSHSRWFCSFWNGPFTQTSVISDPKITSNNSVWTFAAKIWQLSLKHCVDLLLVCDAIVAVCFGSYLCRRLFNCKLFLRFWPMCTSYPKVNPDKQLDRNGFMRGRIDVVV